MFRVETVVISTSPGWNKIRARFRSCTARARSFSFKKNCNFFLTHESFCYHLPFTKKKKKILKLYPIHYVKPWSVSTLLNIPVKITAEMFTKGKNPVINSVVYCKTAPVDDPTFLLFLVSTCLSIPRNVK